MRSNAKWGGSVSRDAEELICSTKKKSEQWISEQWIRDVSRKLIQDRKEIEIQLEFHPPPSIYRSL